MCLIVFFQAEDGIRDLVRSRGLGDVYKRQHCIRAPAGDDEQALAGRRGDSVSLGSAARAVPPAVSYTHLTLPTSDLV